MLLLGRATGLCVCWTWVLARACCHCWRQGEGVDQAAGWSCVQSISRSSLSSANALHAAVVLIYSHSLERARPVRGHDILLCTGWSAFMVPMSHTARCHHDLWCHTRRLTNVHWQQPRYRTSSGAFSPVKASAKHCTAIDTLAAAWLSNSHSSKTPSKR